MTNHNHKHKILPSGKERSHSSSSWQIGPPFDAGTLSDTLSPHSASQYSAVFTHVRSKLPSFFFLTFWWCPQNTLYLCSHDEFCLCISSQLHDAAPVHHVSFAFSTLKLTTNSAPSASGKISHLLLLFAGAWLGLVHQISVGRRA